MFFDPALDPKIRTFVKVSRKRSLRSLIYVLGLQGGLRSHLDFSPCLTHRAVNTGRVVLFETQRQAAIFPDLAYVMSSYVISMVLSGFTCEV